jgi:hypothetical protein
MSDHICEWRPSVDNLSQIQRHKKCWLPLVIKSSQRKPRMLAAVWIARKWGVLCILRNRFKKHDFLIPVSNCVISWTFLSTKYKEHAVAEDGEELDAVRKVKMVA